MYRGFLNFLRRSRIQGESPQTQDRAAAVANLTSQRASLQSAMQAAESGFLTLGRQMESMSQMADAIARLASDVLEATSGTGEKGALRQATQTVEKVFARAESRQSHYTKILARLRDIGAQAASILTTQNDLSRALFPLGPLAMGFRIETARLVEDEARLFLNLADSITSIQTKLLGTADRYFVELADIFRFVERMTPRVATYSNRLALDLSRTREGLDKHLACLTERWAHAAEASTAADGAVRDILAKIGKIIVATQYQDITRQQIEHISTALDEIRREYDVSGTSEHKNPSDLASFVRHAGLVQCRQMEVVAHDVDAASKTIVDGMRGILDGADILARCQRVAESSGDDLVDAFRADIGSVTTLDDAGSAISDEMAAWIAPAARTLSAFTAEIRLYSVGIRFAAINAQIHACRAHNGEVLEVLASRLQLAADVSLGIIDHMSRILRDIISDLTGGLDQSRTAAIAEGNELRQETGQVTMVMGHVQTDMRSKAAELTVLYRKLTEDTQKTISLTDLQGTVIAPVLQAKSALESLVGSLGSGESAAPSSAVGSRIAALRHCYTMKRERTIHDNVAASLRESVDEGAGPEPALAGSQDEASAPEGVTAIALNVADAPCATGGTGAPVAARAESLGDNVELF